MEEIEILSIISKYNPWWSGKEIPKSQTLDFRRNFFHVLTKEIDKREITVVLGPRRVGKTVLMYQLIKHLLDKGVNPNNVLYISVDNKELIRNKVGIEKILETYYKLLVKKPMDSDETVYVFLDEIQDIEDWHDTLKNLWDLKYRIKFFVSGSATTALSKGAMESLLGRVNRYTILSFKFSEVLDYNKIELGYTNMKLRTAFTNSLLKSDPKILFDEFNGILGEVVPLKDKIEIFLNKYFIAGGYPEFLDSGNDYLLVNRNILEKLKFTFYQDIIRFYKVRNAGVLDDLFSMVASSSGTKININKTARDLNIQRPTLKTYLEYFKNIFLVAETEFFSRSRRNRALKNRKIYVLDTGIRNASIGNLDDRVLGNSAELGKVAECFVFDHLMRLKFILEPSPNPKLFYWENKKEVDFIFELKSNLLPIEVKYSNTISNDDLAGINDFIKTFKSPFGLVLSRDVFEQRGNILIIPIWLFSLMI